MSPAALRRYAVGFVGWTVYETFVLASSEANAITKGQALYNTDGLGDCTAGSGEGESWYAQSLDEEVAL